MAITLGGGRWIESDLFDPDDDHEEISPYDDDYIREEYLEEEL